LPIDQIIFHIELLSPVYFQKLKLITTFCRAKRYERMMRAHGIAPNAASIKPAPTRAPKSERRQSSILALKKRKADQFLEEAATDDDESLGWGNIHIKEDPREEKYNMNFKAEEGDHKPRVTHEQGQQLNLQDAANLMQYYDNSSQLVVDDLYSAGDFGGSMSAYGTSSGYTAPMGSAYGLESQNGYFGAPYSSGGMAGVNGLSSVPRSSPQGFQYQQHIPPYPAEEQGHSDSPLIVE
jgi:alkylation response protein AidB-like acyl-CoA dehydrogenase